MWNTRLDEAQAGIKTPRRNINNLRYVDHFYGRKWRELKSLLIKVKEESEKAGLKLNIQKPKNMASSPITSCQIDGETVETVSDFIFWGSQITADGAMKLKDAYSLEEKLWPTLPGASVRNSAHGKGHEEGGLAYAKAWSSLRKPPVPEHLTPKPESVLCSPLHLWLYGGLSPITVSLGEE